ncbi:MAG: tRNA adenosine(34) deaminase TadA [Bacilli bacterium]
MNDEFWMSKAIECAVSAEEIGEVPIGAVVVYNNEIIATGYNLREKNQVATAHAEIIAINKACEHLGTWRLENCTLYVTLEPCPMCAGAIVLSRIPTVVFGAFDPKGGCCGSIVNLLNEKRFNHQVEVRAKVLETECAELLQKFFRAIRERKRIEKIEKKA